MSRARGGRERTAGEERVVRRDLEVRDLVAGYRKRPVLEGIDLPLVRGGTVTSLVGPNGAGKSTLLRALAGLVRATGTIRFGGEDLLALPLSERSTRVAFMPQTLPQRVALTVLEAVVSAIRASPIPGFDFRDARSRALEVLEGIGMAGLALESLDALSGGQRQLASLAQAVARGSGLLLLDEPTSALDLRHQVVVMGLVRRLADEGRAVVVVLHDLELAARWSDRIIVLGGGKVRADGPPSEALTEKLLADVWEVRARVEPTDLGWVRVRVDGPIGGFDLRNRPPVPSSAGPVEKGGNPRPRPE